MKSIIESKSGEETKNAFVRTEEEMRKHIRMLEKIRNKATKNDGSGGENK
jgi:hypothetical protein